MKLSKSIVGKKETAAVKKIIEDYGYLGMGKEVLSFEEELATYLGRPSNEVVCVNSGTAALHLAIEAVTNPGDEVLVPTITYVATYSAITAAGCKPVSCDVTIDNLNICLLDAQRKVTERTRVIIPVHFGGTPCDLQSIGKFAKINGLRIIEDAAHAFGSKYMSMKIGSIGDITCFSFDGIKNITSGEGGAIISSDREFLTKVKNNRLLGVQNDSEARYKGQRTWDINVQSQGYRYHMSDVFAAIGRVQLSRFEKEFSPKRKLLAKHYVKCLESINWIIPVQDCFSDVTPHIFPVRILNGQREKVIERLATKDIPYGLHYKPNHLIPYFNSDGFSCPNAEKVYSEILTFPLHPELSLEEIDTIINIIKDLTI